MKEVQITPQDHNLYFTIYHYLKEGKNPSQVCSKLGIKKQKLNYYIAKLKQGKFIKKIGYGTWEILKKLEVQQVQITPQVTPNMEDSKVCTSLDADTTRGHAFMFVLKIPNGLRNWERRREYLDKCGLGYDSLNNLGGGEKLLLRGKKIHLKSRSIIIYDKASYVSELASESKSLAVYEFLSLINHLEGLLNVSFKIMGKYKFRVSREHYSLIKNCLAKQYNKEGKKLFVSNAEGLWMLIDNSYNLNELETVKKGDAVPDSEGIKSWLNSMKETDFKVTPTFVLEAMHGIQQNQVVFDNNMKSHIQAIKDISLGVKGLNGAVRHLTKEVKGKSRSKDSKVRVESPDETLLRRGRWIR